MDLKDPAVEGIENLVLSFLDQLVEASGPPKSNEPLNAHQRRARSKNQLQLVNRAKGSSKTLTFPRKHASGSDRPLGERIYELSLPRSRLYAFVAQLFRVLDLTHEAIIEDVPITKRSEHPSPYLISFLTTGNDHRDMYYNDVQLFRSQKTVDSVRCYRLLTICPLPDTCTKSS